MPSKKSRSKPASALSSAGIARPAPISGVAPLTPEHNLSAFDCSAPALNDYLRKYAYQNHQNRSARTYVAAQGRARRRLLHACGRVRPLRRNAPASYEGVGQIPRAGHFARTACRQRWRTRNRAGQSPLERRHFAGLAGRRHHRQPRDSHPCQRRNGGVLLPQIRLRALAGEGTATYSIDEGYQEDSCDVARTWRLIAADACRR